MKQFNALGLFLVVALLVFLSSCQEKEQERQVTEKEVPQPVLQAFATSYPDAAVKEYAEEIEAGQKFYEVSFESQGRKIDITYKPDGEVFALEEIISAEELPQTISEAISKEFQHYSLEIVEEITKEGKKYYEVKLLNTDNKKRYELLFSSTGKLLEKETMGKEEED